jgi:hypothetical protein
LKHLGIQRVPATTLALRTHREGPWQRVHARGRSNRQSNRSTNRMPSPTCPLARRVPWSPGNVGGGVTARSRDPSPARLSHPVCETPHQSRCEQGDMSWSPKLRRCTEQAKSGGHHGSSHNQRPGSIPLSAPTHDSMRWRTPCLTTCQIVPHGRPRRKHEPRGAPLPRGPRRAGAGTCWREVSSAHPSGLVRMCADGCVGSTLDYVRPHSSRALCSWGRTRDFTSPSPRWLPVGT